MPLVWVNWRLIKIVSAQHDLGKGDLGCATQEAGEHARPAEAAEAPRWIQGQWMRGLRVSALQEQDAPCLASAIQTTS
jgi:hypothetical protein